MASRLKKRKEFYTRLNRRRDLASMATIWRHYFYGGPLPEELSPIRFGVDRDSIPTRLTGILV